jgi:ketosteroid isomerase-like protein
MGGRTVSDDVADIVRLTHDYALYNDTFRIDELVELFVAGAWFDMEPAGLGRYEGRDAIRAFFEKERRALSHLFHLTANHRVDVDGDRAAGTAYYLATGVTRRDGVQNEARGYYADSYVRTADGWRFASRQSNALIPWVPVRRPVAPAATS